MVPDPDKYPYPPASNIEIIERTKLFNEIRRSLNYYDVVHRVNLPSLDGAEKSLPETALNYIVREERPIRSFEMDRSLPKPFPTKRAVSMLDRGNFKMATGHEYENKRLECTYENEKS